MHYLVGVHQKASYATQMPISVWLRTSTGITCKQHGHHHKHQMVSSVQQYSGTMIMVQRYSKIVAPYWNTVCQRGHCKLQNRAEHNSRCLFHLVISIVLLASLNMSSPICLLLQPPKGLVVKPCLLQYHCSHGVAALPTAFLGQGQVFSNGHYGSQFAVKNVNANLVCNVSFYAFG